RRPRGMSAGAGDLKPLIAHVAAGGRLTRAQAETAFDIIMSGNATPAQMGGFLMALRVRGETVEEVTGAASIMRAKSHAVRAPADAMDVVGTGGDNSGTYNVSTASALVVAACGVPVAKHGNRALSSKSGAGDVLAALGVDLEADYSLVERAIHEIGIGFMLAPRYHSAMRNVGPTRVELGTRTIFNILGPLSNPAQVKRYLVGTFAKDWVEPMARVLGNLGAEHAWVVHGADGLDELTLTGPSHVSELKDGAVRSFTLSPADAGLPLAPPAALKGGDAAHNAKAMTELLAGARGPFRDFVLYNSAAALLVAGKAANLPDGARLAAAALDDGRAARTLERLVAITSGRA
ncbi:MAG TPA: anthranilate phosphoribosyltransferase, partial [Candidatus Sulfotelmatobacter sp.]|nr:anthranilate phosphoribosyltransferase [Candidatus Sulfotelmatobacter sp.]